MPDQAQPPEQQPEHDIKFDEPHAARIWNYWMGGKDNYSADRTAGDAVAAVYPDIVTMAQESRQFLIRTVRYLAGEAGIQQFLDIGTGLPTMQNTHEVAQEVAPESRIVYVDNDPLVLVHARALLTNTTSEGVTTYVNADYHDPDRIITEAATVLDFDEPVAVMFMGVLGYVVEPEQRAALVSRVMDAVPSGSYLVLWEGTDTGDAVVEGGDTLSESGAIPYHLHSPEQIGLPFEGMEMVAPGLVPITHWRSGNAEADIEPIDAYGGIARKS